MEDRTITERYSEKMQEAKYKALVYAYEAAHKYDAEKEPEPESDLARMAREMGAPAPGFARNRKEHSRRSAELDRKLRDAWRSTT